MSNISQTRATMLYPIARKLGRTIRAATVYHDAPAGIWKVLHYFFSGMLTRTFLLWSDSSLVNLIFGLTSGYLVLEENGSLSRLTYEDDQIESEPLLLEGAEFNSQGTAFQLRTIDRYRVRMCFQHTCWVDEQGAPMLHPAIGHESVAMANEIAAALQGQLVLVHP